MQALLERKACLLKEIDNIDKLLESSIDPKHLLLLPDMLEVARLQQKLMWYTKGTLALEFQRTVTKFITFHNVVFAN